MVYAVTKFWHYLLGNKFFFHVDHSALVYLVNKQSLHDKFARWMLIFTEFDFTVVHMPGKMHAVADYLSWLEHDNLANYVHGIGVHDNLPDADLILHTVQPVDWYEDMFKLLQIGYFSSTFTRDQRKRMAVQTRHFHIIFG